MGKSAEIIAEIYHNIIFSKVPAYIGCQEYLAAIHYRLIVSSPYFLCSFSEMYILLTKDELIF
jgi:hypothetical protein